MRERSHLYPVMLTVGVALAGAAFAWLLVRAQRLPDGPVPIVWDKEPCAECRMHIGDPHFAAQLQLADGRVLDFDDPGCLFTWLAAHDEAVHAAWFRHHRADGWLSSTEVGFVKEAHSPMGFGLAAVARTEPGARSFDEVLREFRERPGRERAEGGAP